MSISERDRAALLDWLNRRDHTDHHGPTAILALAFVDFFRGARRVRANIVPSSRAEADLAIVGATIIHPERDENFAVQPGGTIIVSGNRISAVGATSSVAVPAGTRVIDGRGKWIVPGLVDGHVHFFQSGNLYTRPDVAGFTEWMPYSKEVERNQSRLPATFKVWLASGVTSVVDVGGPPITSCTR